MANTISESLDISIRDEITRMNETIGKRIKRLRTAAKMSQAQLADACGWKSQSRIGNYEADSREPSFADIEAIAKALRIDKSELLLDMRPVQTESDSDKGMESKVIAIDSRRKAKDSSFIKIPHFDIAGSMGNGNVHSEPHIEVIRDMTVHMDWLRTQGLTYSKLENLAIVTGDGDSMAPTFNDGDSLLVDRGITEIRADAIYFFTLDGQMFIKRLQRIAGGSLRMISDNQAYPPQMIEGADLEKIHIQARVLLAWNTRKL